MPKLHGIYEWRFIEPERAVLGAPYDGKIISLITNDEHLIEQHVAEMRACCESEKISAESRQRIKEAWQKYGFNEERTVLVRVCIQP